MLPDFKAYSKGRDTLLSFEKNVGEALITACTHDDEAMHLMRAANVVRKDIFNSNFVFDGSFKENCQQQAVPPSLLALVNVVSDGANIEDQSQMIHSTTSKAALSISQLLVFDSVKHVRTSSPSKSVRHYRSQETPLLIHEDSCSYAK